MSTELQGRFPLHLSILASYPFARGLRYWLMIEQMKMIKKYINHTTEKRRVISPCLKNPLPASFKVNQQDTVCYKCRTNGMGK